MPDNLSIVIASGTVDKLMAAANITAGASALGRNVTVFLTMGGLLAFRRDDWKTNRCFSQDLGPGAEVVSQALLQPDFPSWLHVFRDALEMGHLRLTACRMTLEMAQLELDDLEPIVSECTNVGDFLESVVNGQALFI